MESVVSAKIKLPSDDILFETMRIYSKAVQYCIDTAWKKHIKNKIELHHECYYPLRKKFGLQSQLTCNAIRQAMETIKNSKSKPIIKKYYSIRYNFPRSASIKDDWSELSISTIKGRKRFQINIPEYFEKYLNWEVRESLLICDERNRLYFCFAFAKEVNINTTTDSKCVGVDLGINTTAVTSTSDFFGADIKNKRIRHEKLVAELQSKGTRATKRKLKQLSGKWERFQTWVNHNISRKIIDDLNEDDILVLEDLKNIRKTAKYNRWIHKWAFWQLQSFLEYKATMKGIRVVYINPSYTSKECNRCHSTDTRRHRGFFECMTCGHSLNADLNGARNIVQRYTRNMDWAACKPAPDLTCDEVEAEFGSELRPSIVKSPLLQ